MRQPIDEANSTTLRLSQRASFRVYVFIGLLVALALYERYDHSAKPLGHRTASPFVENILNALLILMTASTLLRWWYERLVADDAGFVTFNSLNRPSRRVRFDELTAYRPTRFASWVPFAGETRVRLPEIEMADFHRLMVANAPEALRAKRLQASLAPPTQDFESMVMFDLQDLGSNLLGTLIVGIPFCLLAPQVGFAYVGIFMVSQMYRLLDLAGRLTLDSSGIHLRWPWSKRDIHWSEATAIFCENMGRERRFVVTSGTTSIVIPRHIALDLDVMRKVLYSLPVGTLCVNFDESIRRGYRRRGRKRRTTTPGPALEPAFGAGF